MAKAQNLVKLAKGGDKKTKPPVDEKPLSPLEERDKKAKQKVQELLDGFDLAPKKDDELLEVESGRYRQRRGPQGI